MRIESITRVRDGVINIKIEDFEIGESIIVKTDYEEVRFEALEDLEKNIIAPIDIDSDFRIEIIGVDGEYSLWIPNL